MDEKKCPACGAALMLAGKRMVGTALPFHIGDTAFSMEIYCCPSCGRYEFYESPEDRRNREWEERLHRHAEADEAEREGTEPPKPEPAPAGEPSKRRRFGKRDKPDWEL